LYARGWSADRTRWFQRRLRQDGRHRRSLSGLTALPSNHAKARPASNPVSNPR